MRVLFTFGGNRGHLDPLLPIARAAERAGHPVAFGGRPWMVPKVEALGFECFPGGTDEGLIPARVPDLDVPHATVVVTASGSFLRSQTFAGAVHELQAQYGLPVDAGLELFARCLVLVPVPPSFRDPGHELPATAQAIRPATLDASASDVGDVGARSLPDWVADLRGLPTVYLTLGTVFPLESGDLFTRLIAGIRDLPVNLVVTIGQEFDPGDLGPQPPNVHVERWLPQDAVLAFSDLVVCHGGSGTVVAALARGLPLVVIPLGADQLDNTSRCEALHVGLALDPISAMPEDVRQAVDEVLEDQSFRDAARRIERECLALPGADHAVELLERVARDRRPLTRDVDALETPGAVS